ncbi:MAG TPA: HAMP domain-containing sensor histidine kinase [Caulobacteraceae bacterium]|jgi:signal transduction histidine kinase|nr:HAMP domain-containing sensor histidine kinase [Caulobacteraceae bacterium]
MSIFGRGLFWRVYLTLLASVVLVALLAALMMHMMSDPHSVIVKFRPVGMRRNGTHLVVLLAVATAVGLAALPVVSRLTHRLERLRASLDAWGSGKLDVRARVEGGDEIAAVAASFNVAADRVASLLEAHKTLLAHASHELRSPLARLRMAMEIYAAAPDPALRPAIEADIAELAALVDEILLASQLDQAAGGALDEPIDLLGLAAEEAARAGAVMAEPVGAGFEIVGSPRLMRRLVRNLIDNAARHGAPPVEIALARAAGAIRLTVSDHGPGIPEGERERVFEPFYRPVGRAEAAGSWGLGLSIVRQIARRHGGTVACQGAAFAVTLPG